MVECDTRDTLLDTPIEAELQELIHTTKGKGCGLFLSQLEERRRSQEIDGAAQSGSDFNKFGVKKTSKTIERQGFFE